MGMLCRSDDKITANTSYRFDSFSTYRHFIHFCTSCGLQRPSAFNEERTHVMGLVARNNRDCIVLRC